MPRPTVSSRIRPFDSTSIVASRLASTTGWWYGSSRTATPSWIRVVAVILALVLPWIGVVMANAPAKRAGQANPSLYPGEKIHELD